MEHGPISDPFAEQEQYEIITEAARAYPDKPLEEIISTRSEYLGLAEDEYRERYGKYGRLEKAFADGRRLAKVDEKSGAERLKEYYKGIIVRLPEDEEILVDGRPLSKNKWGWEKIRKMGWGRLKTLPLDLQVVNALWKSVDDYLDFTEAHLWALYTVEEVAQLAEVNEKTVRRHIQDGRLEAHRGKRFKGGLLYLITGYEILRWLVIKETGFDLYGFSCLPFRLGDQAALQEPARYLTMDHVKKGFGKAKIRKWRGKFEEKLESGKVDGFLENGYWLINSGSLWEYINSLKKFPKRRR